MVIEDIFMKYGFVKEENDSHLKDMIKSKDKIKEVYIDIYPENPFIASDFSLLLRTHEKNAKILIDDNRLIFKRNDRSETYFVNVLISKITECFSKIGEDYSEFILKIQNAYYKVTILN